MNPQPSEMRDALRGAARWLSLLDSGSASDADLLRLEQWRASNPAHEHAWQKALLLRQRFSSLPGSLAMATLDRPDAGRRALLKQALGVAVLLPSAWLISRELPIDAWAADVRTGVGERRELRLADGTSVQLNTDSAVDIDGPGRRITLRRGEVAVKTPGNLDLRVQVPTGQVQLGGQGSGAADVCLRLLDSGCRVSVTGGRVRLQPGHGSPVVLEAGQQASLLGSGVDAVTTVEPWLLGWREGVLRLDDRRLGELLAELRRYRPGVLRWSPAIDGLRVTGTFRLDDTDQVLALLAASLPVQVQARTRYWVTLTPRENSA